MLEGKSEKTKIAWPTNAQPTMLRKYFDYFVASIILRWAFARTSPQRQIFRFSSLETGPRGDGDAPVPRDRAGPGSRGSRLGPQFFVLAPIVSSVNFSIEKCMSAATNERSVSLGNSRFLNHPSRVSDSDTML